MLADWTSYKSQKATYSPSYKRQNTNIIRVFHSGWLFTKPLHPTTALERIPFGGLSLSSHTLLFDANANIKR
jgi:hypothetical protein